MDAGVHRCKVSPDARPKASDRTVKIIQAVGASRASNANMKTAAKSVAISDLSDVSLLAEGIEDWCDALGRGYSTELTRRSLLNDA
jgi:hypothetical protein